MRGCFATIAVGSAVLGFFAPPLWVLAIACGILALVFKPKGGTTVVFAPNQHSSPTGTSWQVESNGKSTAWRNIGCLVFVGLLILAYLANA